MVEILVSELCDCRPPRVTGGRFDSDQCDGNRIPAPAGLFPIVLRIVFSIVRHCFCVGGFSVVCARPYIVIGGGAPL
jgi:hypothetical protein